MVWITLVCLDRATPAIHQDSTTPKMPLDEVAAYAIFTSSENNALIAFPHIIVKHPTDSYGF